MDNLRLNALALHLGVDVEDLNISYYYDRIVEYGNSEYLVVTDDEADDLWEQDLDNYLEECIYPELPELAKKYFDDEAWKNDARFDGRAHSLNRYDGNEENTTVYYGEFEGEVYHNEVDTIEIDGVENVLNNSEEFYIYRQN